MRIFYITFCALSFWPKLVSPARPPRWIVWNVGQGAFTTVSSEIKCEHFDLGGEFANWASIRRECQSKRATFFISHADWDHLSFFERVEHLATDSCRRGTLAENKVAKNKRRLLKHFSNLPQCADSSKVWAWTPHNFKGKPKLNNEYSQVALIRRKVLVTGDSPKKMERIWSTEMPSQQVRYLLLGHHGSRTSTSVELLDQLSHLKIGIASAREKKYHHPHPETELTLKLKGIALLKTEDWGSLSFPVD